MSRDDRPPAWYVERVLAFGAWAYVEHGCRVNVTARLPGGAGLVAIEPAEPGGARVVLCDSGGVELAAWTFGERTPAAEAFYGLALAGERPERAPDG